MQRVTCIGRAGCEENDSGCGRGDRGRDAGNKTTSDGAAHERFPPEWPAAEIFFGDAGA